MKPYILTIFLASICAQAQIVAPGAAGDYCRAIELYQAGNYQAALAQLGGASTAQPLLLRARTLFALGDYERASAAFSEIVAAYPASAEALAARVGVADCLFGRGRYGEALAAYRAIDCERLAPADQALYTYRCGVSAYQSGDSEAAANYLAAAAKQKVTRSAANYYLGVIAFERKDYAEASKYFALTNHNASPGNHAPYYLAQIDFVQGQWVKALTQARQVLRNCSPDQVPEMQRVAGESLVRLNQKGEGIELLRKYLAADVDHAPSASYLVGLADYDAGDYSKAVELLRPAAAGDDPVLAQSAYLYIGQALMHSGDKDAALMSFEKATEIADGDPKAEEAAYYNYAVAKFSGASIPFKSSTETFERFLQRYPAGPYSERVAEYLAEGYYAEGDYAEAVERIDHVSRPTEEMQRTRLRALYALADEQRRAGKHDASLDNLNKIEGYARYDAATALEAKLLKATILTRRGEYRTATPLFRAYLDQAPPASVNRAMASYGLGYALYNQKDVSGAMRAFLDAVAGLAPPTQGDAYNRLGDLAQARNDYAAATEFYKKALPTGAAADYSALQLAKMLGYQHDYAAKLSALNSFMADYPKSPLIPDALLETTQAQISMGRNSDAVATYRRLIADYPSTSQGRRGYLEMAMTLLDMQRRADAIEAYRSVISLYPSSEEASQAAALLKNLYADDGRADEYFSFIKSVEHAPQVDAAEAEELAYTSAINAYKSNGNLTQAEAFVRNYPASRHQAEMLGMLLDNAEGGQALALAEEIMSRYPDSRVAERAMSLKAKSLYDDGSIPEALEMYRGLKGRASDQSMAIEASLGLMRCARDMGDNELAASEADVLMGSGADADGFTMAEAQFTKACVLEDMGKTAEAIELWQKGAANPGELWGAKSAYRAAEALFESGKNKQALAAAQKFVKSGSRQRYWVARGFILLSDIYKAQGNKYEARQYIEALRDNYPGDETDIKMMIESRLAEE